MGGATGRDGEHADLVSGHETGPHDGRFSVRFLFVAIGCACGDLVLITAVYHFYGHRSADFRITLFLEVYILGDATGCCQSEHCPAQAGKNSLFHVHLAFYDFTILFVCW